MKKFFYLFTLFLGLFVFVAPSYAAEAVNDEAGLFTEQEIQELNQLAEELNNKIKGEVFILTTNRSYSDPEEFTDLYLSSQIGNDNNGMALMVNMTYRDYHISTSGNMIDYLTDRRIDNMKESNQESLSAGDYFTAAKNYLSEASQYVSDGVPRGHYRIDRETGKITYYKTITFWEAFFALLAAAILSAVFFFVIKSRYQLKMGGYRYPYNEKSSLKLSQKEDRLTNSFVTTRRIPRNTSSGGGGGGGGSTTHSTGGGSFGGGGGKF